MTDETAMRDIFVIGGGINGCGIARDAAGRGYSVTLAEMNDLGSGTSSWSTKLVHGGLRYLEFYEFRLVREALKEREVLWQNAPHVIRPLRFVLPHHEGLRPAWLLRLGLFLYDHLGGRKLLPPTATLDMRTHAAGNPLKPLFTKAFEYSDCQVDDARFVVLNARDAADRGARILPRTRVVRIDRDSDSWRIATRNLRDGTEETHRARIVVNAAGPWVDEVSRHVAGENDAHNVRLVQGSHIVVHKLYDHDRCYIFQNEDGRIIFAIPYQDDFTMIGTTDRDYQGDPGAAEISDGEIDYLCEAASEYFKEPVTRDAVAWTFSGVRPLYDDGASKAQEATRDYVLRVDRDKGEAPILNIFGGKLTTYRKLAEAALDNIGEAIGRRGAPWTAESILPGGDFPADAFDSTLADVQARHASLDTSLLRRLFGLYGLRIDDILSEVQSPEDLGQCFGADLYEAEVRYLVEMEWAFEADDILWRRSKLGLHFSQEETEKLRQYLEDAQDRMHSRAS